MNKTDKVTRPELLTSSYDYFLPENKIASKPAEPRDTSKIMVIDRKNDNIEHSSFKNIVDYLESGDLIVLNDTRVIPARLFGRKNFDGALVEVFLVRELEKNTWLTLAKPAKRLKINTFIYFSEELTGKVKEVLPTGERIIVFSYASDKNFMEIIGKLGEIPFPPYISAPQCDTERYQTVFSKNKGSVAAPTAGLHFTEELFSRLKEKGIKIAYLTLHIGIGTFLPLKTENVLEHKMHEEYYELSKETAELLNRQKNDEKRIIAVGTTVTRVLEAVFNQYGKFSECKGFTDIFIYPGYKFQAIDTLITNFHLPASTLLMLVSAFWDREKLLNAYENAIKNDYQFYSLGDSMILF